MLVEKEKRILAFLGAYTYKYLVFSCDSMIKTYHIFKDNTGIYRSRGKGQFDFIATILYVYLYLYLFHKALDRVSHYMQ